MKNNSAWQTELTTKVVEFQFAESSRPGVERLKNNYNILHQADGNKIKMKI